MRHRFSVPWIFFRATIHEKNESWRCLSFEMDVFLQRPGPLQREGTLPHKKLSPNIVVELILFHNYPRLLPHQSLSARNAVEGPSERMGCRRTL